MLLFLVPSLLTLLFYVCVCACVCQEGDRLSDEDLIKFLGEIKKTSAPQRRFKTIPGHFASLLAIRLQYFVLLTCKTFKLSLVRQRKRVHSTFSAIHKFAA